MNVPRPPRPPLRQAAREAERDAVPGATMGGGTLDATLNEVHAVEPPPLRRPNPPSTARPLLSLATLARAPSDVRRPAFDPQDLRVGILHLGCGAFHRAHQALLTQRAIEAELGPRSTPARRARALSWGIASASLRTPATVHALRRQNGLYTVLERGPRRVHAEVVGTLREAVFVPNDSAALLARFDDPGLRIVTVTVTAAGYGMDAATGRLNAEDPDVRADLSAAGASDAAPRSVAGLVTAGLARRRAAGGTPPVLISCDNMPHNGRLLRQACLDFAMRRDERLAQWIALNVQFPNSMVDRIVPAPSDADRHTAAARLGLADAVPVAAEPFRQWVIEHFDGPRPCWEAAGAEFVADVAPWEASKLRLLNGGHLAVAYLGLLSGATSVADAVADPVLAAFALRFMVDEQRPTLPDSDHDIRAYAHQLLERWRNPGIAHQLQRIARDGSSKLPARVLDPLRDNLRERRPAPCTLLVIAAWMACVGMPNAAPPLQDAFGQRLRAQVEAAGGDLPQAVGSVLAQREVFGEDLSRHQALRAALVRVANALQRQGARATMAACLSGQFT